MINPQNERLQIDAPIAFVCTFFIFHPRTPKTIIICLHYTYTTSCVYEYIPQMFASEILNKNKDHTMQHTRSMLHTKGMELPGHRFLNMIETVDT